LGKGLSDRSQQSCAIVVQKEMITGKNLQIKISLSLILPAR
jgi:hypothetical protein